MEHTYLIMLQRRPRKPINNETGIEANRKIEAIYDGYNYFKSYLYQKFIYNDSKINKEDFQKILTDIYNNFVKFLRYSIPVAEEL